MKLITENDKQIRGDLIKSIVVRSDMAPVPMTVEAEIRVDTGLKKLLAEGKILKAGEDEFRIVKAVNVDGGHMQGQHDTGAIKVTGLLDSCHQIAFVRQRSVIKENATLAAIYRACGASLKAIDADFAVPRFYCYVGDTPSFHIARVLQEEGGVVRWKSGKMKFFRLQDLFKQKPMMVLPANSTEKIESGFLERHEVPWFYSTQADGGFVYGNQTKARSVRYAPFTNALRLQNMTRCLIRRRVSRITYSEKLCAGDVVEIKDGKPLVILTAARVFQGGADGSSVDQYTRLWLADLG